MYIDADKVDLKGFPITAVPTQFFFDKDGEPMLDKNLMSEIGNFESYANDNEKHTLTAHRGLLTESQLIDIFESLGTKVN
jgi:hypothetical protein